MSFMLDNRANKQSQLSLSDEADLKENRVALAKLTKEIAALTPKSDLARLGMTDEDKETLRQKQAEYTEVKGAVDRGSGKKKQKDIKDLAKALEDETKGESGEKEDKPKEAPKTT
jgi:hypothetical protein